MTIKHLQMDSADVQAAIYSIALSLDGFLLNGIQYGVLQPHLDGFLQKTVSNLLNDLTALEEITQQTSTESQTKVVQTLGGLRATCHKLTDLVIELCSFRAFSLPQLRSKVSQVPRLRKECVERIQALESCFGVAKPFYQSRPVHSTEAVNDFLTSLERVFVDEWSASTATKEEAPVPPPAGGPPSDQGVPAQEAKTT
jgi:hypothetical protein